MQGRHLEIIAINAAPPTLDLSPEAIAARADELGDDHVACADLDDRQEQAHGGDQSWPGLMRPLERQSIAPRALAWDGGEVQARPPGIGQSQGTDDRWLRRHGRVVDATWGAADGVSMVAGADVPTPGAYAVGDTRPWGGHVGPIDHGHAGVCAASASRQGNTPITPQEAWARGRSIQPHHHTAYLSHRRRILERVDGL
jgi:hypothetical protein